MRLHYEAVHRLPDDDCGEAFRQLCAEHDASLIACDFPAAEAARAAGIPFGIYDPIPWFWARLPSVSESAALYMCQDFFGVRERVRDAKRKTVVIVPPVLLPFPQAAKKRSRHVLVNLGGLLNPFQSQEDSVAYARLVTAIVPGVARLYPAVHVATSQSISELLQHEVPAARTVSPCEAQHLLGTSELAVMTPGLGNIYEAAALAQRVFWLPPANNSQGQQLDILRRRGLAPFAADWHEILPARAPIDYCDAEPTAMKNITDAIHEASEDPTATQRLWTLLFQAHQAPPTPNPLTHLLDLFGTGGARVVAENFMERVLAPLVRAVGERSLQ